MKVMYRGKEIEVCPPDTHEWGKWNKGRRKCKKCIRYQVKGQQIRKAKDEYL